MVKNVNYVKSISVSRNTSTYDIEVDSKDHAFLAKSQVGGGVGISHNSALISLSNLSDDRMRNAKMGKWWEEFGHRAMANNSVAYTEKPEIGIFMKEWQALYDSKSGERGIFNRAGAIKQAKNTGRRDIESLDGAGVNPCLSGNTLVYVADGRNTVSIKQLAEENKDVEVFCFDDDGKITTRVMRAPRITGYNKELFKVTLSDGNSIEATKNHKFRLLSGDYKEVRDLVKGDMLIVVTSDQVSVEESDDIKNDVLKEHILKLTKELNRRVTTEEWIEYATKNNLPNTIHNYRINHLNGIKGFIKWAAIEAELELVDTSSLYYKEYMDLLSNGYDCEISNGQILINKTCEICGNHFKTLKRENGICSHWCAEQITRTLDDIDNYKSVLVESVDSVGFADVYNGTVDDYHNFFIGGFDSNGNTVFLNNLQCGEIVLRPNELCNLTEVIIRENDTLETLKEKVKYATILGTFQATLTDFKYVRNIWKKNCEEERLLGVSLTGIMDHPILSGRQGLDKTKEWCIELKQHAIDVNKEWAEKLGINQAASITCTKPSGCTTLDTKIKTVEGIKSMEDIFNMLTNVDYKSLEADSWIQPNKGLYVYDENNERQLITKLYVNGTSDVYEIEDTDGNTYKFTGNHKLKTVNGWKRVDELTVDDEIIGIDLI